MIRHLVGTIVLYITAGGLQALMGDESLYSKLEIAHDADCGQYKAILRDVAGTVHMVAGGPTRNAAIRNLIEKIISGGRS